MQITIMIVDDHAVVRDGLRRILEDQGDMVVVAEAANGREAITKAAECHPRVILMDVSMPDLNGIEATRSICASEPGSRVIVLSMHRTKEHVFRAVKAGAQGYILKESAGMHVVRAIRAVAGGRRYFCTEIEDSAAGYDHAAGSPLDSLSTRERQVLQFVVEGKTSAEIAGILELSPKSVETYRSRLMLKLGIDTIPALVKFAVQHGITPA